MFHVYGLQAIGKPAGPVKIGFSSKPADRISALEPGALGERLHVIFLIEAGETYGEGRRVEKACHDEFSSLRINREWFRFDQQMLTYKPEGTHKINIILGSPAENTAPAKSLTPGDLSIFNQSIIKRDEVKVNLLSGDLSSARTIQKVIQRV